MRRKRTTLRWLFDLKAPTFRHKMFDAYKGNKETDAGGAS